VRISDMNWLQVDDYLKHDDRAVLPIGSTEQHSYLRLTVDCILPERVAAEAAEPLGILVFFAVYGSLAMRLIPETINFTLGDIGRNNLSF
jgi:creatinine amidohydrolase